jgi:hypothetical protein
MKTHLKKEAKKGHLIYLTLSNRAAKRSKYTTYI